MHGGAEVGSFRGLETCRHGVVEVVSFADVYTWSSGGLQMCVHKAQKSGAGVELGSSADVCAWRRRGRQLKSADAQRFGGLETGV